MQQGIKFRIAGDSALVVEFGDTIDETINRKVRDMHYAIQARAPAGVLETIPTYRSVLVYYDPLRTVPGKLADEILYLEEAMESMPLPPPVLFRVPVLYGGEYGLDLNYVATHNNLSTEQVVQLHAGVRYRIYMLGFTPGFCYLGGLPQEIATPRLANPRTKIPAGSVGIAGSQTGIYSIDSPGGWQLIGKTPLKLFDPPAKSPFLFSAGNYLQFVSVDTKKYSRIKSLCEQGLFTPETEELSR